MPVARDQSQYFEDQYRQAVDATKPGRFQEIGGFLRSSFDMSILSGAAPPDDAARRRLKRFDEVQRLSTSDPLYNLRALEHQAYMSANPDVAKAYTGEHFRRDESGQWTLAHEGRGGFLGTVGPWIPGISGGLRTEETRALARAFRDPRSAGGATLTPDEEAVLRRQLRGDLRMEAFDAASVLPIAHLAGGAGRVVLTTAPRVLATGAVKETIRQAPAHLPRLARNVGSEFAEELAFEVPYETFAYSEGTASALGQDYRDTYTDPQTYWQAAQEAALFGGLETVRDAGGRRVVVRQPATGPDGVIDVDFTVEGEPLSGFATRPGSVRPLALLEGQATASTSPTQTPLRALPGATPDIVVSRALPMPGATPAIESVGGRRLTPARSPDIAVSRPILVQTGPARSPDIVTSAPLVPTTRITRIPPPEGAGLVLEATGRTPIRRIPPPEGAGPLAEGGKTRITRIPPPEGAGLTPARKTTTAGEPPPFTEKPPDDPIKEDDGPETQPDTTPTQETKPDESSGRAGGFPIIPPVPGLGGLGSGAGVHYGLITPGGSQNPAKKVRIIESRLIDHDPDTGEVRSRAVGDPQLLDVLERKRNAETQPVQAGHTRVTPTGLGVQLDSLPSERRAPLEAALAYLPSLESHAGDEASRWVSDAVLDVDLETGERQIREIRASRPTPKRTAAPRGRRKAWGGAPTR